MRRRNPKRPKTNPSARRLRSRNRGKIKCETIRGVDGKPVEICAIGRKYGFEVRLLGRGSTPTEGPYLPVFTPGYQRTAVAALKYGKAWLKRFRPR